MANQHAIVISSVMPRDGNRIGSLILVVSSDGDGGLASAVVQLKYCIRRWLMERTRLAEQSDAAPVLTEYDYSARDLVDSWPQLQDWLERVEAPIRIVNGFFYTNVALLAANWRATDGICPFIRSVPER